MTVIHRKGKTSGVCAQPSSQVLITRKLLEAKSGGTLVLTEENTFIAHVTLSKKWDKLHLYETKSIFTKTLLSLEESSKAMACPRDISPFQYPLSHTFFFLHVISITLPWNLAVSRMWNDVASYRLCCQIFLFNFDWACVWVCIALWTCVRICGGQRSMLGTLCCTEVWGSSLLWLDWLASWGSACLWNS